LTGTFWTDLEATEITNPVSRGSTITYE